MPVFAYKGRDGRGELVRGVLEGVDNGAVASQLFSRGVTPIEITVSAATDSPGNGHWLSRLTQEKVTNTELLLFSRQMYTLLKAGVPIMRALAGLQESATNKSFKAVLGRIREGLDSGRDLAATLQRDAGVFSPFYISMVRAGEMSGKLQEIFLSLFHHIEFENFMRNQVRSALRYPSFVAAAMTVALVVINLFVIPAFAKVYAGFKAKLPLITELIIGFSNFMVASWPYMLALAVGAVAVFRGFASTPHGRYAWDRLKLRIPIAGGILLKAALARLTRSFALAYRSGVPVVQGLTLVAQVVDNDFVSKRIEKMREGVERGESVLRTAAASGIFTPVVLQMIAVGEETGALDDLMEEIANMYQSEVEYELKTLSAQIEPILIVGLGIMVLILALGVFLPLWDLGKAALH